MKLSTDGLHETSAPSPDDAADDTSLLRKIAAGDMAAFSVLIQRHQQRAHSVAFHITASADAADDITQEAFLRVLRTARTYRPSAQFTTFLHRIVVNLCLDRAKRPRLAILPEDASDDRPSPAAAMTRDERLAAIRKAIASLPERQRVALVLHRFEDQSHAAIAESTGWTESAVEALLVRAYAELRQKLKDWKE